MKTIVIHRHDRPERLQDLVEHLRIIGWDSFSVFDAIIDKPGWKGCRDSHLAVMEDYKDEVMFLVLEDDVRFVENTSEIVSSLFQLPQDWDCLFLGVNPQEPQKRYSKNLFKLSKSFCTHSIIWHPRKGGAVEYILEHKAEIEKIDVFFCEKIFPNFNCFLTEPLVCVQSSKYNSDTCKKSDVGQISKNYSKYCL
jgi:GR25 family glycosyltransferase involved in LPS biosynthesis